MVYVQDKRSKDPWQTLNLYKPKIVIIFMVKSRYVCSNYIHNIWLEEK